MQEKLENFSSFIRHKCFSIRKLDEMIALLGVLLGFYKKMYYRRKKKHSRTQLKSESAELR